MQLLIGTDEGVFAMAGGAGAALKEEGPESAALLSAGPDAAYAVTAEGALWRRFGGEWQVANEHPVNEAVWSLAADPRVAGLVYLGVHTAVLHRSAGRRYDVERMREHQADPQLRALDVPRGLLTFPTSAPSPPTPSLRGGVYIWRRRGRHLPQR